MAGPRTRVGTSVGWLTLYACVGLGLAEGGSWGLRRTRGQCITAGTYMTLFALWPVVLVLYATGRRGS